MIKLLVIEEQALLLEGLLSLLKEIPTIEVVGTAKNHEEGLNLARTTHPKVVIIDMNSSSVSGLETIRKLTRVNSNISIIILASQYRHPFPYRALQSGATGFVTKNTDFASLVDAIKKVNHGSKYISADVAQHLALNTVSEDSKENMAFESLSGRELQVMIMITSGLKVLEISEKLCLSPKTVNSYRYRLFEKLKIKSDVELTHLAINLGIIEISANGSVSSTANKQIEVA